MSDTGIKEATWPIGHTINGDKRMTIRDALDHAVRPREATPGMPQDGPYPATVGEVADEVVAWIKEMDTTCARGLTELVARRLAHYPRLSLPCSECGHNAWAHGTQTGHPHAGEPCHAAVFNDSGEVVTDQECSCPGWLVRS